MKRPSVRKDEILQRLYKRRFVVPNAVTVGNMFCGFLAVAYATSGRFDKAVIAIAIAILLDGFDGKVARKLNATSKFGMEFDSLSDAVSFGVAPAVLMYNWCFKSLADEFGVIVSFFYLMCTASRLARFNVMEPDLKKFTGLPSPAAAGVIAALVYLDPFAVPSWSWVAIGAIVTLLTAYLMVSKIPYLSVKTFSMGHMPLRGRLAIGAIIALTWYSSQLGFMVLGGGYALSGPLLAVLKRKSTGIVDLQDTEDESAASDSVKLARLK